MENCIFLGEPDTQKKAPADLILLDSGGGTGRAFDHGLLEGITRPYFLAGGLTVETVAQAIRRLHPFGVVLAKKLRQLDAKLAAKKYTSTPPCTM